MSNQLHVIYNGESHDLAMASLDIGDSSTDEQIRNVVANHFGVPITKLRSFAVDRNAATGDITLRPEAVFG